jgi:hypothetical protein
MNGEQQRIHPFEEFGVAAEFAKDRLALRAADTRVVQVDVHHRLAVMREADQERQTLEAHRNVGRVPALRGEKQVLPLLEAQQCHGLELSLRVLTEHDGIVRLEIAELRGERGREHDVVAVLGAARRDHAQVFVLDVIQ